MSMTAPKKIRYFCLAAGTAIANTGAWGAQPVKIDVGAGLEYHSNAGLVNTDEKSDVARIARAGIAWSDPVGPLSGDVNYRVDRRDFVHDVQEDETAVNGRAALKWDVSPRLFDVIAQQQITRTQTDLRTTDISNNRERRSVSTAGFDGYLHFSSVDSLVISPRYTDVSFSQSTQSDSKRANVDLSWLHELDALSKLTLQGGFARVRFDDSEQNYDATSAQLSYATALSRLSYSIAGGVSRFNREHLEDVNGNSLHLSANYHADSFDAGGNAVRELTDSSIGLVQNEFTLSNFTARDSNFNQVDILEREQADLYWRQRLGTESTLNFAVGGNRDNYKNSPSDQDQYYGQADFRYTVNIHWSLGLSGRYARSRFLDDPQRLEYKEVIYTVSAQYRFNPKLDFLLSLSRQDRNANVDTASYTDNVAALTASYRFN